MTSQSPTDTTPTEEYRNAWSSISYMVRNEGASWSGRERNCIYLNTGNSQFADISAASGADWIDDARTAVPIDWDLDGDLDLLLRNRTAPRVRLLRNNTNAAAHYLSIQLASSSTDANRKTIIGAQVKLTQGERSWTQSVRAGEGYLSQAPSRLHFGLGSSSDSSKTCTLEVRWPDGQEQRFEDVAVDRHLRLQPKGQLEPFIIGTDSGALKNLSAFESTQVTSAYKPSHRVVLSHKLPMGPLPAPGFDQPARTLAAFQDRPVLINLWATWCQSCRVELKEFQKHAADFKDSGLAIVPLTTDDPEDYSQAREILADLGLDALAGIATEETLASYELILKEVLGTFDQVPMPTSLLLDKRGQLVTVYLGPVDPDTLLKDVRTLEQSSLSNPYPGHLSGGTWLRTKSRQFGLLARSFRQLNREDLFEFYRELHRR